MIDMKLLLYLKPFNCLPKKKKKKEIRAGARLKMAFMKRVYNSYIFNIYMNKEDWASDNLQVLICHITQPNQLTLL